MATSGLSLLDMPIEVLTAITKQLQFSLYNFILVSKKCHEIGHPFLCNHKKQNLKIGDQFLSPEHHQLYLLLQSLIRGTAEPGEIRKFSVAGPGYEEELDDEWSELKDGDFFDEEDWSEIRIRAHKLFPEELKNKVDELIYSLECGKWDGIITLILSFLWNLEELDLLAWNEPEPVLSAYISRVRQIQEGGENGGDLESMALPRLRKVGMYHHDTEGCMGHEDVAFWGNIPSVKVLEANAVGEDDDDENFDDDAVPLPDSAQEKNVEKIILSYCGLPAVPLAGFLRQFTGLKYFEYDQAGALVSIASWEPPKVTRALWEVRHTLEVLKIGDPDDMMEGK
jgi:hypothetical protein